MLLLNRHDALKVENQHQRTRAVDLAASHEKLQQKIEYVSNAYDGLKHKHDHLQKDHQQLAIVLVDEQAATNTRKEEVTMWKARAQDAERKVETLEADLSGLRQVIRDKARELDRKYGVLPEKK